MNVYLWNDGTCLSGIGFVAERFVLLTLYRQRFRPNVTRTLYHERFVVNVLFGESICRERFVVHDETFTDKTFTTNGSQTKRSLQNAHDKTASATKTG